MGITQSGFLFIQTVISFVIFIGVLNFMFLGIINLLHVLSPDEWTAINVIVSAVVAIGVTYGYLSLREMARNHRLNSAIILFNELKESESDRNYVLREFLFNPETINNDPSVEKRVRNVINIFNRLGLLIETDTLSQKMLFSLCYPVIIQNWYKLKEYARYQEKISGVPYARRVERLANMAINYYDANPKTRGNPILLYSNGESIVVHSATIHRGLKGYFQRVSFLKMRITNQYF